MSNVHRVLIQGRMPYDIVERLNEDGVRMFARLVSPTWGFKISYGKASYKPVPETGGRYRYYEFTITGEEAVWESSIVEFCKALKEAGAEIDKAEAMDMEMDNMPVGGSIMEQINKG